MQHLSDDLLERSWFYTCCIQKGCCIGCPERILTPILHDGLCHLYCHLVNNSQLGNLGHRLRHIDFLFFHHSQGEFHLDGFLTINKIEVGVKLIAHLELLNHLTSATFELMCFSIINDFLNEEVRISAPITLDTETVVVRSALEPIATTISSIISVLITNEQHIVRGIFPHSQQLPSIRCYDTFVGTFVKQRLNIHCPLRIP